jgi:hypothetical protein
MVTTRTLTNEEIYYYIDMLFYDLSFLLPDDIPSVDRKLIYDTVNKFRDSDDRDSYLYTDDEITDVLTRIQVKHGGRKSRKKRRSKKKYK